MSWLRIFTLFCMLQVISGYCYLQVFDTDHCTASNGDTIPVGAELVFKEKCERCSCSSPNPGATTLHMSCCGYGINGGVMMPPEGCKIVKGDDGCSVKVVKIADETQLC